MSTNLQSIMNRIRALLAKTQAAGCTEEEALSAVQKAEELLSTYQLSLSEVELGEEGVERSKQKSDPRGATAGLVKAISLYCGCRGVRSERGKAAKFLGLRSDCELAGWLLSSMETFAIGQALGWSFDNEWAGRNDVDTFVNACLKRIAERLMELANERNGAGSHNALMVTKNALIAKHPEAHFFQLRPGNWKGISGSAMARDAGNAAGNKANFARPLGGRVAGLLS